MNDIIKRYINELKHYNEQTNIYSKKAYDLLDFHINDSITLASIIENKPKIVFDFGSGSGLPAIPIGITNPQNQVYAIESKSRKTHFLNHIKTNLKLNNITIITKNLFEWKPPIKPHVITAKAFASLEKIELIIKKLALKNSTLYIPISKDQQKLYSQKKSVSFIEKNSFIYLKKIVT